MHRSRNLTTVLACFLVASLSHLGSQLHAQGDRVLDQTFRGQPLRYWIAEANAEQGPRQLERTVAALAEAVRSENPNVKHAAADAIAVLGPRAKTAIPALLEQLGHEAPWVRVACQAALGSMGAEAVPALIDTVENQTGGPQLRAAFVLGGIGKDAQPAVPVLLRIMENADSPVVRTRLQGILSQIDPDRFGQAEPGERPKPRAAAVADAGEPSGEDATKDWPQFHGPRRNSICREEGLLRQWPADGPPRMWTVNGLGRGYSTVAIADGRLLTMGDLPIDDSPGEAQFVIALDLNTRKQLWTARVGDPHADGGPRCTPTIDGERVYALGTSGDLVCLETASGQQRWHVNLVDAFDGKVMNVWKFSESPLVDGDRLICTPGGPAATMVALNKHTGELIWKCAAADLGDSGMDGAGYSSAVVASPGGVRQYVQLTGRGVIGVEAATGRLLWSYNRIANTVANIPNPVVRGNYIFVTTAYNTGAALLEISPAGDGLQASEVYFVPPRDFQNHHGGVVLVGDYIYGGHGSNRGDPACLEFRTGKVMWKKRAPARGSAGVLYADGHLVFRYDRGEVVLIEATPEQLRVKGQFKTPPGDGPGWAHPVIHNGLLYLRHADNLHCYDVRDRS